MEVHQLRYLLAILDEGSFTAAAAKLHVSQSGVSAQVAKLERELGQQLLSRDNRAIALTAAGEAIAPLARDSLAALDAIPFIAAEFADAVRGPVRLGMIPGCDIPGVLDVVADVGRTHPGVSLSLSEDDSTALESRVRDRAIDVALLGYGGTVDPGVDLHRISEEPLIAVAAPGTRFAARGVSLADLQKSAVLCLPVGSGIRAAYDQSCARAGLEARVDIEATSPQTLVGLARRGAGVAVLPESSLGDDQLEVVVAPIRDATVLACLGLLSRPDEPSPAVRMVLGQLVAALTQR